MLDPLKAVSSGACEAFLNTSLLISLNLAAINAELVKAEYVCKNYQVIRSQIQESVSNFSYIHSQNRNRFFCV